MPINNIMRMWRVARHSALRTHLFECDEALQKVVCAEILLRRGQRVVGVAQLDRREGRVDPWKHLRAAHAPTVNTHCGCAGTQACMRTSSVSVAGGSTSVRGTRYALIRVASKPAAPTSPDFGFRCHA